MNLSWKIARKYFFSGKVAGVVHVISGISMLGITIGTAALVIILSVFNGFEELVVSLYNSFDPDIKIESEKGKYFTYEKEWLNEIASIEDVSGVSPVIEENVLAKYSDNQTFAKIKGLDPQFLPTIGLDSAVFLGEPILQKDNFSYALVGMGVSGKLGLNIYSDFRYLQLFIPKHDKRVVINPRKAFNKASIRSSGVFSIQREFDDKYILLPLPFAASLVGRNSEITSIEVNVANSASLFDVQDQIKELMPKENFRVLNRFEQHAFLYRILRSEKSAVYLILTFVLLIAGFNLIGSLSMLAIEKKKDVAILGAMGMEGQLIRRVFLKQGIMLSMTGACIGMLLGIAVVLLQKQFGFVKLGGGSFVTESYPVFLNAADLIVIFITVSAIGFLGSYLPAIRAYKKVQIQELQSR